MKSFLTAILSVLLFCVIAGSAESSDIKKPSISFDSKSWDFGSVPVDFRISHSYKFKAPAQEICILPKSTPTAIALPRLPKIRLCGRKIHR